MPAIRMKRSPNIQKALRINPHVVAAHNNLGTLLVELGRFDEAMNEYTEAAHAGSRPTGTRLI